MPDNKVKFGLKNVHYALITEGEDGAITYGTPKRIPGAVNLSLAAQGDTETFYADDIAYYVSTANNGYQGDLEIALVPDSFRVDVLGETLDEESQVLMENSGVELKPFALLYEFTGDQKASRRVMYNCTATRPSEESQTTNNTKTPSTDKLTLTAAPLSNGLVKAKTTDKTPVSVFSGWYGSVWQPASTSGGAAEEA